MHDIHITDLDSFVGCRRAWSFASPMRRGLQRAMTPKPLYVGQLMHIGLGAFYSSERDTDASMDTMREWSLRRAEAIRRHSGPLWDEERDMVNESYSLCCRMLEHYEMWSKARDARYEFIATENMFSAVPIPVPPEVSCAGYSQMLRMGNYYDDRLGRLVSGHVQLAGRFDGVVRDLQTGDLYLLEFKTARSISTINWVFRGLQGTIYTYAARYMYGDQVKGIMYRILRKQVPSYPEPLNSGGFSQRKDQKTTFEFFKHALDVLAEKSGATNPKDLYRQNEKVLRELHGRRTLEGNDFFVERILHKSPALIESALRTVYFEGMQMASPNTPIYAKPGWNSCNNCSFKDPCDLMEMGMDDEAEALLESEYAPRTYWEWSDDDGSE